MKLTKQRLKAIIKEELEDLNPDVLSDEDVLGSETNSLAGLEDTIASDAVLEKLKNQGIDVSSQWDISEFLLSQGLSDEYAQEFAAIISDVGADYLRGDMKTPLVKKAYPDAKTIKIPEDY